MDNRKLDRQDDPRTRCYNELRECMETEVRKYYFEHKDRLLDERSRQKLVMLGDILLCIFAKLDNYDIAYKSGESRKIG